MPEKAQDPNIFIMTVLILGLFIGMGLNIWFIQLTFIRIDAVFLIAIIGGLISAAIYFLFFRHWKRYLIEIMLYSFIGWGSIASALFLSLNYIFHTEPETVTYGLPGSMRIDLSTATLPIEIKVEDPMFAHYPYMLSFEEEDISVSDRFADRVDFTLATGLFGYQVLMDKELR